MRGALAGYPKVTGRIHQPSAEVALPNPIDHHAHRDWLIENCVGQLQAAAALSERLRSAVREDREETPRNFITEVEWVSAIADTQIRGLVSIADGMQVWILRVHLPLQSFNIGPQRVNKTSPLRA